MSIPYNIDGQEYPHITTILAILDKPTIKQWAVNLACDYVLNNYNGETKLSDVVLAAKTQWEEKSKAAMDIGSEIRKLMNK